MRVPAAAFGGALAMAVNAGHAADKPPPHLHQKWLVATMACRGGAVSQLRFDAVVVPEGATRIVPTFTLSREALSDLGTKLKLLASDLPMVGEE